MNVQLRTLIFGLVVIVTVPAGASAQTPAPTEASQRTQVYQFERAIKTSVDVGGQKLAEQAKAFVPDIMLTASEVPIARGVKLDEYGYHFDVQVPNIDKTSMMVFETYRDQSPASRSRGPLQPVPSQPPSQPVSSTRPGGPVPVPLDPLGAFDADREYVAFVKEAIMDTMVDNSAGLMIAAGEWLTLSVSAMDQADSRVLSIDRKMILRIKGSDLLEVRQGKITREQAKARIQLSSF